MNSPPGSLDARTTALIRVILWAIMFVPRPNAGNVQTVMGVIIDGGSLGGSPREFRDALRCALASDASLSDLCPGARPEVDTRRFLKDVLDELDRRRVSLLSAVWLRVKGVVSPKNA